MVLCIVQTIIINTLSDYCTKWVEAIALPSKHATEVALPLFKVRKSVLGFIVQLLKCPGGSLLRSRVSGGHSTTRGRLLRDRAHGHRGGNGMGTRAQSRQYI